MSDTPTCAGPWCNNPVKYRGTGRRPKFCSDACRLQSHRKRKADERPVEFRVTLDRDQYDALTRYAQALGMSQWDTGVLAARIIERELRREDILAIVQPELPATRG